MQPRKICWVADSADCSYTYSGLTLDPLIWPEPLMKLKIRLESEFKVKLNSCLCNLYRDGSDYMSYHADDEKELGRTPSIFSISLGAARRFIFKHKRDAKRMREFLLEPGSCLMMAGALQDHYKHALPKMLRIKEPRINLTFRYIVK